MTTTSSMQDGALTVLDCTLRDGGYYTDWVFDDALVDRYLQAIAAAGVDVLELGFRFTPKAGFIGPYGYTTDRWIDRLRLPEGLRLGVMCNASDLVAGGDSAAIVDRLFASADRSKVAFVRIAAHFREVEQCIPAIHRLAELGYGVGFNLMQAGGKPAAEITARAALLEDAPIEALYFADSMGNMDPDAVRATVAALRASWSGAIGFHAHNNMGRALDNAIAAVDAGASWLDATVLGMGRGAGNLAMEYLLLELTRRQAARFEVDELLAIVLRDFGPLQREHGWGPNLFYHLSALYEVHPTYVQEMLADDRYSEQEIVKALELLGASGASGYSEARLREALEPTARDAPGTWSARGWLEGRTVLIVAPGAAAAAHLQGIEDYIDEHDAFVLCLNSNSWFPAERIDAWIACNADRLLLDLEYLRRHRGTLIVPASLMPQEAVEALADWTLLDYGLVLDADRFEAGDCTATLDHSLVALYALALANAAGAAAVRLVGFDGYTLDDPRHAQMEAALKTYGAAGTHLEPVSITPTNLSVPSYSVYAPEVDAS